MMLNKSNHIFIDKLNYFSDRFIDLQKKNHSFCLADKRLSLDKNKLIQDNKEKSSFDAFV